MLDFPSDLKYVSCTIEFHQTLPVPADSVKIDRHILAHLGLPLVCLIPEASQDSCVNYAQTGDTKEVVTAPGGPHHRRKTCFEVMPFLVTAILTPFDPHFAVELPLNGTMHCSRISETLPEVYGKGHIRGHSRG